MFEWEVKALAEIAPNLPSSFFAPANLVLLAGKSMAERISCNGENCVMLVVWVRADFFDLAVYVAIKSI